MLIDQNQLLNNDQVMVEQIEQPADEQDKNLKDADWW